VFSGRTLYVQIGAMMGTIMAWNVYFVIIPAQRKLVEAKERNVAPDPVYGLQGKQRSVHKQLLHAAGAVHHDQQPLPDDVRESARVAGPDRDPAACRIRPAFFQPSAQGQDRMGDSDLGRRCHAVAGDRDCARQAGRRRVHVCRRRAHRRDALRDPAMPRSRRSRDSTTRPRGLCSTRLR
jgi:hypothetical protein